MRSYKGSLGRMILALAIIFSIVFSGVFTSTGHAQDHFLADQGSLSLDEIPAHPKKALLLDGTWWYKPGELVSPAADASGFQLEMFPFLWTDKTKTREARPPVGVATYKLLLRTSMPRNDLGLEIPDMYSSFVLYAGTTPIARNGVVSETTDSIRAHWLPLTITLPELADSTWLTLHIANREHSKAGIRLPIYIDNADRLMWKRDVKLALDWLLAGCLLLSGVFMLGLFLFSRGDKAMLFYGLVSVTWSYRVVGFGTYALHTVLPEYPWNLAIHVEYLTLFLTTIWFVLYVYSLFPAETSKRFLWIILTVASTYTVIVLVTPPAVFTTLVTSFFYFLIVALVYGILVFVRAAAANRPGARLSLVSTAVLFMVFGYNILVYLGYAHDRPLISFLGYFAFFLLQTVILGVRYAETLQQSVAEMKLASDLKGRFLAQMSHELRTPLNAIIGYAQLLSSEGSLGPRPKKHVTILQNSAQHLLTMINEILDFSRLDDGEVKINRNSFRINSLATDLQTLFQLQADEKALKLDVLVLEDDGRMIRADELRLRQILINLIGNAIKFTDSGTVTVRLTVQKESATSSNGTLIATISDSGRGIPEEDKEAIFQPFRQVAGRFSQGTGLGLAITKRLLTLMGGTISVESRVGKGSDFSFQIPVQLLEIDDSISVISKEERTGLPKGLRAFIVDDVVPNGEMLEEMLRPHGVSCVVSRSAKEARMVFSPEKFDVVLLDMNMPEETGAQLLESLRKEFGNRLPPFMAVTADITHSREEVIQAGFSALVYKPFDQEALIKEIASVLPQKKDALAEMDQLRGVRKWITPLFALPKETSEALRDALSFADTGAISKMLPTMPNDPFKAELARALKEKDFKFLMDLGQAAEFEAENREI